ncbi:Hypothetical predicted protein [Mytilus galloprovincialis]|uniref:Uncharacterized protein n=1 Tax=Mytilus galloprovincialis TaxID=29158 RepID=A0A8B6ESP5_MYTGA|nr:Hypothetical predicted protein [Mytilus galloprovincialis]
MNSYDSIIQLGSSDNSESIIQLGPGDNSDKIIGIDPSDNSDIVIEIGQNIIIYNSQYKAAQALECLALLAFVAAVICAFLKMFVLKEKRMMFVVTGFLNLVSGITALIGVLVFATFSYDDFKFDGSMFHYSFGLCIVGGIGGIFSGIVFILAWRWVRN